MTRRSHTLVGLALGVTAGALLASAPGVLLGMGIVAGANLPDDLELPRRPDAFGNKRPPVVPHRTITHWPWTYVAIMVALVLWRAPVAFIGVGIALGALAHLLCDCFSPHGIPWLSPFRSMQPTRAAYTTGRFNEWVVVMPLLLLAIGSVFFSRFSFATIGAQMLHLVMHPLAR